MIWYEALVEMPQQPPLVFVKLTGLYNPDTHPSVTLVVHTDGGVEDKVIFSHHPTGLCHEEPTPEQVRAKYLSKVGKVITKLRKTPFPELGSVKAIS